MQTYNIPSSSISITALSKKHQKGVNRFIKYDAKYNELVDQEKDCTRPGEKAWDNAMDAWNHLPVVERRNVTSKIDTMGY